MIYKKNTKLTCWEVSNKDTIYYYTYLDKKEIAMIDIKNNIVYLNTSYKNKYPTLQKKIKSYYKDFSEYCNMI